MGRRTDLSKLQEDHGLEERILTMRAQDHFWAKSRRYHAKGDPTL